VIRLREIERSDVPVIHSWRSDHAVVDSLTGVFRYVNREVDDEWFDRYMKARDRDVRLGVVLAESGLLVGVAYLLCIDWIARNAQYGLMIGERDHWGKGIGTQATQLTIAHAFDDLNLHRLSLQVFEDNVAAIHIYEKCGFQHEGVMRDAVFKGGRYRSLVMMGLLRNERTGDDGE
jgi:diamine N-acetyltransferase